MQTVRLKREMSPEAHAIFSPFLDIARNVGVGVSGTRGVGKTHLLRIFALLDFLHHRIPTVVIDPVGKLSGGILTQFCHYHPDDQAELGTRLRYVDWSHPELVFPTPAYERTGLGSESFYELAQKLPDVFIKMDPPLLGAGKQGANPLRRLAVSGGEVLQAMGYQATELDHLLRHTSAWEGKILDAKARHPEVAEAADYLLHDYNRLRPGEKDNKNDTLLTKLAMLSHRPMKARFGATHSGISKAELMNPEAPLLVIHDVSAPQPYQDRQFKMLWLLLDLFDFAKRGGTGRDKPLSIIVDEASALLSPGPNQSTLLATDLAEFINQWSRNANVWLTMAYQEPYQLRSPSREAILSLSTHFYGRMTDPPSARLVAERHYDYDPEDVHQTHNVWGGHRGSHYVIDEREEIYSWPEQLEKHRAALRKLHRYEFLQVPVRDEGDAPRDPRLVLIERFNRGIHPNEAWVAEGKRRLLERHGQPVGALVTEIERRKPPLPTQPPTRAKAAAAKAPPAVPPDALFEALPHPPPRSVPAKLT